MTPRGHVITRGQVPILLFLTKANTRAAMDYTCLLTPLDVEGLRVILCIPIKVHICLSYKSNQLYLLKVFACINVLSIFLHAILRSTDNITVVRIIQTNGNSTRNLLDFVGLVQEHRLLKRFQCKAVTPFSSNCILSDATVNRIHV